MRGHAKSLDANDKLIQTRSHVRNAIASRERQVVMRKVKSTIRGRHMLIVNAMLKNRLLKLAIKCLLERQNWINCLPTLIQFHGLSSRKKEGNWRSNTTVLHFLVIQATASHISAVMIPSCRSIALTVVIRTMTVIVRWTATQHEKIFPLKLTCRLYLANGMQCRLNVLWDHDVTLNSQVHCVTMYVHVIFADDDKRALSLFMLVKCYFLIVPPKLLITHLSLSYIVKAWEL